MDCREGSLNFNILFYWIRIIIIVSRRGKNTTHHLTCGLNVKGIYNCVNAAMPSFLQKHAGCILTVSSMWGQVGASCEAAYSATKGAVIALTKALAKELGPSGIRVNCIAPGVIETDMCANVDPEIMEALKAESPIGRTGTPADVAQAMRYRADADFVIGQVLPVNGGFII